MEIFQVAVFGVVAAVLALMLKKDRPEMALQIGLAAGTVLLLLILGRIGGIVQDLEELSGKYGIDSAYLGIVVKILCIAYISEFGAQLCKDAGENAIASKIELGGKVLIGALALPVMGALLESVVKILP